MWNVTISIRFDELRLLILTTRLGLCLFHLLLPLLTVFWLEQKYKYKNKYDFQNPLVYQLPSPCSFLTGERKQMLNKSFVVFCHYSRQTNFSSDDVKRAI